MFAAVLLLFVQFCAKAGTSQDSGEVIVNLLPDAFFSAMEQVVYPVLIDARDIRQFSKYKIEGSVHAPTKKSLMPILDTLDREIPVFLYCEVGFSSRLAAKIVADQGFKKIYNLEKGIFYWKKQGFPVVRIKRHERKKDE